MKRWTPAMMLALTACGTGTWSVTTWGEDYLEEGIPAAEFADGCSVVFDTFEVAIAESALLDGDGDVVAEVDPVRIDVVQPGPHAVGSAEAAARYYDTARFRIAPDDSGTSIATSGTLTCGSDAVTFDWTFATDTTYLCEPTGFTLAAGGSQTTELTVHGDHLFYDGLEAEDAQVRGQAWIDADADEDGVLTLDELANVAVAPLGYTVGSQSEVEDLAAFVTHLTRTLGHVNGEGHCAVSF